MATLIARRYLVRGVVQGVGFRFFTEAAAVREGLDGYVRNLTGGHVEVLVEGRAEAVGRFERLVRRGPPLARVDGVQAEGLKPTGRFAGFAIRG